MQAGKMRNKVTVYTPDASTNVFGEVELTFTSLGEYYCALTTRVVDEVTMDQALVSVVRYDLRFRYYSALENLPKSAYIILGTKTLDILSIANVKNVDKQIQILCEERT